MFKNILVCLDGSPFAEQILPYAIESAQRFGSRLILFEVTKPPSAIVQPSLGLYRATRLEDILRGEEAAAAYLDRLASRLKKKGLDVSYATRVGMPGEAITEYARKNRIGLIALTTHGRSGVRHLVFGSVAEFVLKNSGLPILIKKPEETGD
jgi:nucleotide-binding universal stress UspA family protein